MRDCSAGRRRPRRRGLPSRTSSSTLARRARPGRWHGSVALVSPPHAREASISRASSFRSTNQRSERGVGPCGHAAAAKRITRCLTGEHGCAESSVTWDPTGQRRTRNRGTCNVQGGCRLGRGNAMGESVGTRAAPWMSRMDPAPRPPGTVPVLHSPLPLGADGDRARGTRSPYYPNDRTTRGE